MRRIWIALQAFFRALFNAQLAKQIDEVLHGATVTPPRAIEEGPKPQAKPKPAEKPRAALRSEAITLLSALQREARLLDFVKEPLEGFSDAQIGAVARDVHRDCGAVIQRMFAPAPILSQEEGTEVDVPAGFEVLRYHLIGNVTGQPPFRGKLMHHGWEATTCELPAWSGSEPAARIIAPVEVELK